MHHLLVTAAAASLALLVAPRTSDPVTLEFTPEAGTRIDRSFTVESSVVSGDLTVVMGGQEVPKMYLPDITLEIETALSVKIVDRFIEPAGDLQGHPRVREITDAGQTVHVAMDAGGYQGMEDTESTMDASSPLEGSAFRIGVGADGEVVAAWDRADDDHDDGLLDGLRPGLDLAGLLPSDPVKVGATWDAKAAVLAEILRPSGDLAWEWSGDDTGGLPVDPAFEYSGELELRLAEIVGGDAGDLARIVFAGALTEVETSASDLEHVPVADGTATDVRTTRHDVEGELLWNVGLGVLHSVEFTLKGEGDQVTTRDEDQPGATYESTMVHTSEIAVRVE